MQRQPTWIRFLCIEINSGLTRTKFSLHSDEITIQFPKNESNPYFDLVWEHLTAPNKLMNIFTNYGSGYGYIVRYDMNPEIPMCLGSIVIRAQGFDD